MKRDTIFSELCILCGPISLWLGNKKETIMKYYIITIVLGASLLFTYSGLAEEKSQKDDVQTSGGWLSAGIGGSHFGPCFYGSITYRYNNNLFTVRYFKADELNFNVEGIYDEPTLSCKEIGFLYGMSYIKTNALLSFSAGIGYVSGTDRGNKINDYHQFESINISTLGVPFEAKFQIKILGPIGIGVAWFGNINSTKSYTGFIVGISIGVL
jgi:hypothetical protein